MTAKYKIEEKLIQTIGQMKSEQQLLLLGKVVQSIPLNKIFPPKDCALLSEANQFLEGAISNNINNKQFENYLSLVANKCEQVFNRSRTTPHLIHDTHKLQSTASATDAIYASLELAYHIKNNKQCPINTMHVINNIEKCIQQVFDQEDRTMTFLEITLNDAQIILKGKEKHETIQPHKSTGEIVHFPKN